ncbi:CLUMA_CG021128, isoform A [Clunio marinus]|uniref:CLUMA_CG021128, isoform A n=1 Tax=Clunio marinus TaxID=568069 RepID=A0A1J1JAL2_9DIPT|nr:CLUMA_CG021128, isoform A [Clunio marinus]
MKADLGLEDICRNNPLQIKNISKYHCFKVDFDAVQYQTCSSFDQEEHVDFLIDDEEVEEEEQFDVLMDDEEQEDVLMFDHEEQEDALFDQEKEEEQEEDDDCDGILANNFHDYGPWSQFQHNCSIENK